MRANQSNSITVSGPDYGKTTGSRGDMGMTSYLGMVDLAALLRYERQVAKQRWLDMAHPMPERKGAK